LYWELVVWQWRLVTELYDLNSSSMILTYKCACRWQHVETVTTFVARIWTKKTRVRISYCCMKPWASVYSALLQFTQLYECVPGYRVDRGGDLCTNGLRVLTAVGLDTSKGRRGNGRLNRSERE